MMTRMKLILFALTLTACVILLFTPWLPVGPGSDEIRDDEGNVVAFYCGPQYVSPFAVLADLLIKRLPH